MAIALHNLDGYGYTTVTLPVSGCLEIDKVLDGVDEAKVREEVALFYGDRLYIEDSTPIPQPTQQEPMTEKRPRKRRAQES